MYLDHTFARKTMRVDLSPRLGGHTMANQPPLRRRQLIKVRRPRRLHNLLNWIKSLMPSARGASVWANQNAARRAANQLLSKYKEMNE